MRVICTQEQLAEGLAVVGRAVPTRSTLPVLSNVLLEAEGSELRLVATDLQLGISHRIPARVEEGGAVTLPARLLTDYVANLDKGGQVALTLAPRSARVHLRCGRYEANISGLDAEEFPPVPRFPGAGLSFPAALLKEAIESVVFAAAKDDTRPVLAGVLLVLRGETLTLVAADGFRLALRTLRLPEGAEGDLRIIVPAKTLAEVARVLPSGEDERAEVAPTPNRNQVMFRIGTTEVVSRLVDGQFPDYERIIPREYRTKAVVSTAEFLRATRAAGVFARDSSNGVRLNVEAASAAEGVGRVTLMATSAERGDNTGYLDAVVEGEPLQVAFNADYLREALDAIETAQVGLDLTGPSSPGVLRPVAADGNGYLHVIMPMSLGG